MKTKFYLLFILTTILGSSANAFGIAINSTLDNTAPIANSASVSTTGTQTGRIAYVGTISSCANPKESVNSATISGERRYDQYLFIPQTTGCLSVSITHSGNGEIGVVAYKPSLNSANPTANYLADSGNIANNNIKTFSFRVIAGEPFSLIVHERNVGQSIGDEYTLEIDGVQLNATANIQAALNNQSLPPNNNYSSNNGTQTGRVNRNGTASSCGTQKPFPGVAANSGFRKYQSYTFTPIFSGCVEVSLRNKGNSSIFAVVYNQSGYNSGDPSQNYKADSGNSPSANIPEKTFSFNVTAGNPFTVVVSEINPNQGFGEIYRLKVGGISLNITRRGENFDFDGDRRSDIAVFRPSANSWYVNQSQNGFTGSVFGFGSDIIVPADYDGDGLTDVAVFRPSNGTWYLQQSAEGFEATPFGQNGDIPMPGDFDGDGKADINVFRPTNGSWYRLNSSNNSFYGIAFGQNGDIPLQADFDGDHKNDIAVFRPSTGTFYRLDSSNGEFKAVAFGFGTDIPVVADYDGDGKSDIAVFRSSNGTWYRYNSSNGAFVGEAFGQNGDIPTPADYDGDGMDDIAVYRPSNGTWYLQQSSDGFMGIAFGISEDKPASGAF